MTTTYLFGKLRKHELEINKLSEQKSCDKNSKNIALKE